MPELFKLYDKYQDQGLVIIGVHIDLGEDEASPVDTAKKLDERLIGTQKKLWDDRDIPFPVALVKGTRTFSRRSRTCSTQFRHSTYDIVSYPTQVLIDRRGKIVGQFDPGDEGVKLLVKTLKEK